MILPQNLIQLQRKLLNISKSKFNDINSFLHEISILLNTHGVHVHIDTDKMYPDHGELLYPINEFKDTNSDVYNRPHLVVRWLITQNTLIKSATFETTDKPVNSPISHNTFKSWSESIEEQVPDEFLDEFTEFVLSTIFTESLESQHDTIEEGIISSIGKEIQFKRIRIADKLEKESNKINTLKTAKERSKNKAINAHKEIDELKRKRLHTLLKGRWIEAGKIKTMINKKIDQRSKHIDDYDFFTKSLHSELKLHNSVKNRVKRTALKLISASYEHNNDNVISEDMDEVVNRKQKLRKIAKEIERLQDLVDTTKEHGGEISLKDFINKHKHSAEEKLAKA